WSLGDHTFRLMRGRPGVELFGLRAADHRAGGVLPAGDRGLNRVEIAGADECLVLGRAVAGALLTEFALLHLGVSEHAVVPIGSGELEHREVQRVPARERDELEAITHRRELLAPGLHGGRAELRLPVE